MKKYIKTTLVIIGLLFISNGFVNAEEEVEVNSDTSVESTTNVQLLPRDMMQRQELRDQTRKEVELQREENKQGREDGLKMLNQEREQNMEDIKAKMQNTLQERKDLTQEQKDNIKSQVKELSDKQKEIIETIKIKREEFKNQMELNKETLKAKIEEARATLKTNLLKIKDERKQGIVENIADRITELNATLTERLSSRVDQIEGVLAGIKSRTDKAEKAGLDVTAVKESITKVEDAISKARASILSQSEKSYTINITTETALKTDVTKTRDSFKADIKATEDMVKKAHEQIVLTAKALAQIPKVDEAEVEVEASTESTTSTSSENASTTTEVEGEATTN